MDGIHVTLCSIQSMVVTILLCVVELSHTREEIHMDLQAPLLMVIH